jgi:hypothetical protein
MGNRIPQIPSHAANLTDTETSPDHSYGVGLQAQHMTNELFIRGVLYSEQLDIRA